MSATFSFDLNSDNRHYKENYMSAHISNITNYLSVTNVSNKGYRKKWCMCFTPITLLLKIEWCSKYWKLSNATRTFMLCLNFVNGGNVFHQIIRLPLNHIALWSKGPYSSSTYLSGTMQYYLHLLYICWTDNKALNENLCIQLLCASPKQSEDSLCQRYDQSLHHQTAN